MATPLIMQIPIQKIPPTTGSGTVARTAANFVNMPSVINSTPVNCMTNLLATLVIDTEAMLSENVVIPTPTPMNPDKLLPNPSIMMALDRVEGEGGFSSQILERIP